MKERNKDIKLICPDGSEIMCRIADTFWSRFRGLMGKPPPVNGEGLLIRPCNSLHMFFMKFTIDAIFMDKDYKIVRVVRGLAPGQLVGTVRGAWQVLEVETGRIPKSIDEGIRLQITS